MNAVARSDSFPIPRIDDCIDKIGHAKFVSKLKGFSQVRLIERTKKLSAFVTPQGLYKYKAMPFGMKNTLANFQMLINQLTRNLEGCEGYNDTVTLGNNT